MDNGSLHGRADALFVGDRRPNHVGDTGARVFIDADVVWKLVESAAAFRREREALRLLAERRMPGVPKLCFMDEAARLLGMTRLPGHAPRMALEAGVAVEIARAAGDWLGQLHALPVADADVLSPSEAIEHRIDSVARGLTNARGSLDADVEAALAAAYGVGWPEALVADARSLAGVAPWPPRVFAHRDYRPRNWLVEPKADQLGVIDFEHARMDVAASDFARLEAWFPAGDDVRRTAFDAAYALHAPIVHPSQRSTAHLLHALGCLVWGARHGRAGAIYVREGVAELLARTFRQ